MAGPKHKRRIILGQRDHKLLSALESFRVIDREQAKKIAPFTSTARANARLLQLVQAGLLCRTSSLFSSKALYRLPQVRSAWHGATLKHQLALNDLRLRIEEEAMGRPEVSVRSWRTFTTPISTLIPLIPDGYLEVSWQGQHHPLFLEFDRGTEGLHVWRRKAELYLRLACSGEFSGLFGRPRFRVAVVAGGTRRTQSIARGVAAVTEKLFFLGSTENINTQGFFSSLWLRPGGFREHLLS